MIIQGELNRKQVDDLLKQLKDRGENLRPAFIAIEQEIIDGIEDIFEAEGPGWQKLSPATQAIRARQCKTGKMLQVSGGLATSIQGNSTITNDSVTVGSNKKYAPFVNNGTKQIVTKKQAGFLRFALGIHKKVGSQLVNPARPFMLITDEAAKESENILIEHLTKGL